jgi:hypothetical protein
MLLVDTFSTAEAIGAAVAALAGAVATILVYGSEAAMRPTASLGSALVRQLARVPSDLWLLAVVLAHTLAGSRRPGRFHELALELPMSEQGNGRRAAIELLGSLAPNTVVLGVDECRVIVHQLAARHEERASVREIGS